MTWKEILVTVLKRHNHKALPLNTIYSEVRVEAGRIDKPIPQTLEAIVRKTLEDYSSDSHNFRGEHLGDKNDLFFSPEKGSGLWGLR